MNISEKLAWDVVEALESRGFETKLVGGCVRDRLRGLQPHDFDIATRALPQEVMECFASGRLLDKTPCRTVPTGLAHGTVTVVARGVSVEVTTLRVDVKPLGRRAEVAFSGAGWREDAARRDFTVNALYLGRDGVVSDFFGGREDLQRGILRFVGDPVARIQEDYLRVFRLFRFWGVLGFVPDPVSLEAAIHVPLAKLGDLAAERVWREMRVMLESGHGLSGPLTAMLGAGILKEVTGLDLKLRPSTMEGLERLHSSPLRGLAQLLALLPEGSEREITALSERLRMARIEVTTLVTLARGCREWPVRKGSVEASTRSSTMAWLDQLELGTRDLAGGISVLGVLCEDRDGAQNLLDFEQRFGNLRRSQMPLDGGVVMEQLAMAPGPELGDLLGALRRAYREGEWSTEAEGVAWLRSVGAKVMGQSSKGRSK